MVQTIDQVLEFRNIPDLDIGLFASFQTTGIGIATDGFSSTQRRSKESLFQ